MYSEEKPDLHGLVSDLLAEVQGLRREVKAGTERVRRLEDAVGQRVEAEALVRPDPEYRDRLYDTKALAERWGVSERTVDNEVAAAAIVPTWIRGARRFTHDAVEAYERTNSGLRRRRKAERQRAAKKGRRYDRPPVLGPAKKNGTGGGEDV